MTKETISNSLIVLWAVAWLITCYCFADFEIPKWKQFYYIGAEGLFVNLFIGNALKSHRKAWRIAFYVLALLFVSRLIWQIISAWYALDINYTKAVMILFLIFIVGMIALIMLPIILEKRKCTPCSGK